MTGVPGKILAVSGGVGGAKLALGLAHALDPVQFTVIANTADDFVHHGLQISPDLDTVMYTLAGLSNQQVGWGQEGESWNFLDALARLGGQDWFRLGDRDLATHIFRSDLLGRGATLSEVTRKLSLALGVSHPILPMSDDRVSTIVHTATGEELAFQHYFVRDRCEPEVTGFHFDGIDTATPAPGFLEALADDDLALIVICPSNPFVSVDPVFSLPGVLDHIIARGVPMVAVSPIVGGLAIKGPAAKMMAELGMPSTPVSVARHYLDGYRGALTGFVMDDQDRHLLNDVEALGLPAIVTNTVMITLQDRITLAKAVMGFGINL
jgi:LPPG:FO 2-phospho-L-lactate transferase